MVIEGILEGNEKEVHVTMEAGEKRSYHMWPWAKKQEQQPEAEKGKQLGSFLEPPERVWWNLSWSVVKPIMDFQP